MTSERADLDRASEARRENGQLEKEWDCLMIVVADSS
jgi:hypothetical protein